MNTKCPKCRGRGSIALYPKLAAVLEQVPRNGFVNALTIAAALGIQTTAANMRLERLRKMKLLRRRGDRRGWLYFLPTCNNR